MPLASFRSHPFRAAGIAAIAALLTACGPGQPASPDGSPPSQGSASAADASGTSAASTERFNAYVHVHDRLAGGAGLGSTRESYERAVMDAQHKGASVTFSAGWIDDGIKQLKEANALPGDPFPALDAAAARLLVALEPLQARLLELDVYYKSKTYLDDDFTKAKARYASTLALFNVAAEADDAFDQELEKVDATVKAARLETLKASGDMLAYDLALAMGQGKQLLAAVRDAVVAANQAKTKKQPAAARIDFTRSDPLLQALEKTLVDARAEHAKKKAAADPTLTGANYSEQASALDALTDMVGMYRSFKASRSEHDVDSFFRAYNSAVDWYNRIPRRQYRILPSK